MHASPSSPLFLLASGALFQNKEQNVKVELQSLEFRRDLGTATGNILKIATPSVLLPLKMTSTPNF